MKFHCSFKLLTSVGYVRVVCILVVAFIAGSATWSMNTGMKEGNSHSQVIVSGELRQWHKVTLDLSGPSAHESDTSPNPFTDYRFSVTFEHESGKLRYTVPGYKGFSGTTSEEKYEPYNINDIRKYTLWGNLMAGGAGVEYYFGYRLAENDLVAEDFRSREKSWNYCRIALEFFRKENIPFWDMQNFNQLVGNFSHNNDLYCLGKTSELYLIYLPYGGSAVLDLSCIPGEFRVSWFNPREGGPLSLETAMSGGQPVSLFAPSEDDDWLAVVRRVIQ